MSRPRENSRKILKKISALRNFQKTWKSFISIRAPEGDWGRKSESPKSPQSVSREFIGSQGPKSSIRAWKRFFKKLRRRKIFWEFFLGFLEVYSTGRFYWAIVCVIL